MQQTRVRAVAASFGRGWGIAEDDGTGNSRFPSGMTTRKALHAADARFARHAAGVALPLVAGGGLLRTTGKATADSLRE